MGAICCLPGAARGRARTCWTSPAGSGSTPIAAERTGRRAFLMELDPLYCDESPKGGRSSLGGMWRGMRDRRTAFGTLPGDVAGQVVAALLAVVVGNAATESPPEHGCARRDQQWRPQWDCQPMVPPRPLTRRKPESVTSLFVVVPGQAEFRDRFPVGAHHVTQTIRNEQGDAMGLKIRRPSEAQRPQCPN